MFGSWLSIDLIPVAHMLHFHDKQQDKHKTSVNASWTSAVPAKIAVGSLFIFSSSEFTLVNFSRTWVGDHRTPLPDKLSAEDHSFFSWNGIFPIGCNRRFEKCAGPVDRKVRFRISPKNYTVNPYVDQLSVAMRGPLGLSCFLTRTTPGVPKRWGGHWSKATPYNVIYIHVVYEKKWEFFFLV